MAPGLTSKGGIPPSTELRKKSGVVIIIIYVIHFINKYLDNISRRERKCNGNWIYDNIW